MKCMAAKTCPSRSPTWAWALALVTNHVTKKSDAGRGTNPSHLQHSPHLGSRGWTIKFTMTCTTFTWHLYMIYYYKRSLSRPLSNSSMCSGSRWHHRFWGITKAKMWVFLSDWDQFTLFNCFFHHPSFQGMRITKHRNAYGVYYALLDSHSYLILVAHLSWSGSDT